MKHDSVFAIETPHGNLEVIFLLALAASSRRMNHTRATEPSPPATLTVSTVNQGLIDHHRRKRDQAA